MSTVLSQPMYPIVPSSVKIREKRVTASLSITSKCSPIEKDTLEYQQTEKIENELKDVDRIRIRKVYACCPGWHSGGS